MKKEDKQKGTGDNEGIVFEKDPSSSPTDLDTDQDDLDANLDDSVVAEEGAADTIKKLREKLKKSEAERQEYLNRPADQAARVAGKLVLDPRIVEYRPG